jgi:hypothetical protein
VPPAPVCQTPAVSDGSIRFALDDGETLTLDDGILLDVYELLWGLAPKPGAASAATAVRGASRTSLHGPPIKLDELESSALREAVAMLNTGR